MLCMHMLCQHDSAHLPDRHPACVAPALAHMHGSMLTIIPSQNRTNASPETCSAAAGGCAAAVPLTTVSCRPAWPAAGDMAVQPPGGLLGAADSSPVSAAQGTPGWQVVFL
jgi:hypothetical protein